MGDWAEQALDREMGFNNRDCGSAEQEEKEYQEYRQKAVQRKAKRQKQSAKKRQALKDDIRGRLCVLVDKGRLCNFVKDGRTEVFGEYKDELESLTEYLVKKVRNEQGQ